MNGIERIFALHYLLQGRRTGLALQDIQAELGRSPATIKRDLRFLRDFLQAPVEYDPDTAGYRYSRDGGTFELPGTWFSKDEIAALLTLEELLERQPIGFLAQALKPARKKLEALLARHDVGLPAWRHRLRLLRSGARETGSSFATVAEALMARKRLRLDYHTRSTDRMDPPGRTVSPQRLVLYRDNWYLDAWCHERQALRTFSLDRIVAVDVLAELAEGIPDKELDRALANSYGIFAGVPSEKAVLRFSALATRWVGEERWHPEQEDERNADGSLIRSLPYHEGTELVMDVLRWGPEVEVIAPESLRQLVRERLNMALACYTAADDAEDGVGDAKIARQASEGSADIVDGVSGSSSDPSAFYAQARRKIVKTGS